MRVIFLVGLPGSGKSTWVSNLDVGSITYDPSVEDVEWLILSTDHNVMQMGGEMTYDEAWRKYIDAADKKFFQDLMIVARDDRDIIIDRTNMTVKSRARVIRTIHQNARSIVQLEAIVFGTNLAAIEWLKRLNSRPGKTVPFSTLTSMATNFEVPTKDEGFGVVSYVD